MDTQFPTKQYVRVFKLQRPGAVMFVAVLMESLNGQEVSISEPKILKIVPVKAQFELAGSTAVKPAFAALPGSVSIPSPLSTPIVSPYVIIFGYQESGILNHLGARPPTN